MKNKQEESVYIIRFKKGVILSLLIIWLICGFRITTSAAKPDYWPTNGWRVSYPEKQGMNSQELINMLKTIQKEEYGFDSITIIRKGYMVLDVYFPPFKKGEKHAIYSCTKSITSAIMGIAIDKGYIENVNIAMIDFFPEKQIKYLDNNKRSILLKHLLMMASGLETKDNLFFDWHGLNAMYSSDDWVQFGIDLPMNHMPGQYHEYSNIVSFLLSAIIKKSVKMDVLEFAQKNLFNPLGITDVSCFKSPKGIAAGWVCMSLKPHDMAKIGWLYLNKGNWDGKQVISESWVKESTKGHISVNPSFQAPKGVKYGYQWWVVPNKVYMAIGHGGQYIIVAPKEEMVVAFTTNFLTIGDPRIPKEFFFRYILSAIESNQQIPLNQSANEELNSILKDIQKITW